MQELMYAVSLNGRGSTLGVWPLEKYTLCLRGVGFVCCDRPCTTRVAGFPVRVTSTVDFFSVVSPCDPCERAFSCEESTPESVLRVAVDFIASERGAPDVK